MPRPPHFGEPTSRVGWQDVLERAIAIVAGQEDGTDEARMRRNPRNGRRGPTNGDSSNDNDELAQQ